MQAAALQSVVDLLPAPVAPAVTSLQLLGNLCLVRHNLQQLGRVDVTCQLERYIDQLQPGSLDQATFMDYATAALYWVYRVLTPDERVLAFRGYCAIGDGCAGCAYAAKAEIAFFCQEIEPRIAALSFVGHDHLARQSVRDWP